MEGGTHAEAIKAGFTLEQSVFITRAFIEIKNECWEHFDKNLDKRRARKKDAFIQGFVRTLPFALIFSLGVIIGSLLQN